MKVQTVFVLSVMTWHEILQCVKNHTPEQKDNYPNIAKTC